MAEPDRLQAQARKCRMLASGLSNSEDVRTLEQLAAELESRARAIEQSGMGVRAMQH